MEEEFVAFSGVGHQLATMARWEPFVGEGYRLGPEVFSPELRWADMLTGSKTWFAQLADNPYGDVARKEVADFYYKAWTMRSELEQQPPRRALHRPGHSAHGRVSAARV